MTRIKNNRGFTLMEIIIALAIIIAIGAIIAINLADRASTAKIRSDIQSTRVLQNALDLYEAELQTPALSKSDAAGDFKLLVDKKYVKNSIIKPQTGGSWTYKDGKLYLVITDEALLKLIDEGLSDEEESYINP